MKQPRWLEIGRATPIIFAVLVNNAHSALHMIYGDVTPMSTETQTETLGFQTEVKQLLHLMIHSLYSNKEIFLRELISNASDAADKMRFAAVSDGSLYGDDSDLAIRIKFDKEANTLSISDNGIGMTAQEAIDNLGTIAKSGTREFMSKLEGDQKKDANLIGQFGVGFYSGFIVADRITVESRRAGLKPEEGVRWISGGTGDFEVETITRAQRGTSVILHLREEALEYANTWKLKEIVGKYSDHISLPILMEKEEWKDGELIDPSNEEAGLEIYSAHKGADNNYWFFELYTDQAALDVHGKGDGMKAAMGKFGGLLGGRPEITMMEPVVAKGIDI